MSEQEAMHMTNMCSTRIRSKEEENTMEDEANQANQANQAKTATTKGNPVNITFTVGKMLQMRYAERQEEGGITMRTEPSTQVRRVQILWQVWPL